MLFTTHALTGAAIGVATGDPLLGFVAAVSSHFLLDAMPHFDQGSFYLERKFKGPAWLGVEHIEKAKKFKVKRDWIMLLADMAVACGLSLGFLAGKPSFSWALYIIGATGGLLPDIFDVSPFWKEKFRSTILGRSFHRFHMFFHWPLSSKYWYLGITTQIIIALVDVFIILKFLS